MADANAQKNFKIEIDGNEYEAIPGQMLIQVTDANNIYIPRFCYHKKLSVAANCRMCLVDVEGARKPSPACATPVMDGMKVYTKSPKTIAYQKSVMEFLLINHPLDCPICDQGGECELQDIAMGYGGDVSKFSEQKRVVPNPDLGSLVSTDLTRCIQCTRCVRFGKEIAGVEELGLVDRGDSAKISTYVEKALSSEISGNIIDVCPVGALTSKPYRYTARAWELQQRSTISPHDGLGSHMYAHVRRNDVMRVVPKECDELNEVWLSDRDRFSYVGLHSEDRLTSPMIKKNGHWEEVSWEEAIDFAKTAILTVREQSGVDSIGALASPSSTNEELYLLQKLLRDLGTNNIDTRLKQVDFSHSVSAGNNVTAEPENIEKSDCILIFGSQLQKEHPLLNVRVKKAVARGAKVFVVNSFAVESNYEAVEKVFETSELAHVLAGIVKVCKEETSESIEFDSALTEYLRSVSIGADIGDIARALCGAESPIVLLGSKLSMHQDFSHFSALYLAMSLLQPKLKGGVLGYGANGQGAEAMGAVPYVGPCQKVIDKPGLNVADMLGNESSLELLFLLGNEPEYDTQFGSQALEALRKIDIVISLSAYANAEMQDYADMILPICTFAENSGSYINFNGVNQSFKAVTQPFSMARPAWKILRVLANYLELDGYDYVSVDDVALEIQQLPVGDYNKTSEAVFDGKLPTIESKFVVEKQMSLYSVDQIVRRSGPLQKTVDHFRSSQVTIPLSLAQELEVEDGGLLSLAADGESLGVVNVCVCRGLAAKTILVPMCFGGIFARSNNIEISKVLSEESK